MVHSGMNQREQPVVIGAVLILKKRTMAKESVAILKGKIDVVEVLAELNAALSEEWLAF